MRTDCKKSSFIILATIFFALAILCFAFLAKTELVSAADETENSITVKPVKHPSECIYKHFDYPTYVYAADGEFTVIDGKTGYVGGINIADEYINETHPLGYWKDTAVRLKGAAVASLSLMYLQMFDMAQNATEPFEKYIYASFGDEQQEKTQDCGVVIPFGDGPKPIYRDYVARSVYLNIINQSQQDLYITTPYLIVDDAFVDALRRAALRGVNVNIIIPAVPDKKAVYCMTRQGCGKLVDAGVKIYSYTPGFIHAKGIVADGKVGVVGTINLDYRSFVHHYECGVFMYDAQAVTELQQDMFAVIAQSQPMLTNVKLRWWEKVVCVFANVFRPLL